MRRVMKHTMRPRDLKALLCTIILAASVLTGSAAAQNVITGEGISGEIDKKRRSPTVSVGVVNDGTTTKILVDAYIAAPEYKDYPIEFEFFINRHFYTSQIRSQELPGPIGINITNADVSIPFNYSIVARTLHPNREFTTVINGAVFAAELSTVLDCTLTTGINSENTIEYVANSVSLRQNGNSTVSIEFDTHSTPSGHTIEASGTMTVSDTQAATTLTIIEDGKDPQAVALSGEVVKEDDGMSSFNLSSADGGVSLNCS